MKQADIGGSWKAVGLPRLVAPKSQQPWMKTLLLRRTDMGAVMAAAMILLLGNAAPMNPPDGQPTARPELLARLAVVALIVSVLVQVFQFVPRSHWEPANTPSQRVLFIQ